MKVAIISYSFPEYCIRQANGLARHCEVLLLLPHGEENKSDTRCDPAVRFRSFTCPRLRQPVRQFLAISRMMREVHRFQPDVVHIQHGHGWFNLGIPFLRKYPLVITIHDPRHHVGDKFSRKTPQVVMDFGFRRADHVIVHGKSLRQEVMHSHGFASERIHVIPHIAIGPETVPAPIRSKHKQILFFGRIWKYKGLDQLIKAQPIISRAVPDAQIVIAGEGEDFEPYRRQMVQPDRFIIHNRYLSTLERDELFSQANVVVLPYITATQSGVIPLAYAHGKPVVATDTGALSEAVEDGVTGRLIPPRDPQSLAEAIVDLLSDPARSQFMGLAGRRKLDAEWSPAAVACQTIAVYQQTIESRGGGNISLAQPQLLTAASSPVNSPIVTRVEPLANR